MKRSKSNASKGSPSPATTPKSPRGRAAAKEVVKVVEKKPTPKKLVKEKVTPEKEAPKSRSRSAKKIAEPKKTVRA
jgi:hypothetical protein